MTLSRGPSLHAVAECAADWITWQDPARGTFVAIVAKVALGFVPGGVCALLPPVDLVPMERHRDRSPLREVEVASDAAPFLAAPEILVVGHAYGPAGRATPSLAAHVALGRDDVTFRKILHVFGDRDAPAAIPTPFRRMALSWERALRTDLNPVGVDPAARQPNLVDPVDGTRAAGTGPVAAVWASRRSLLGTARRSDFEAEPMTLPAGFDGSWFQAAPPDQWLASLVGDEWISLDGLHPSLPRLQTKLPGLRVGARVETSRGGRTIELRPDRLVIDTDRQRATLTYRGSHPIDPADLAGMRLFVGYAVPGGPVTWPDATDPTAVRQHVFGRAAAAPLATPLDETTSALETTSVAPPPPATTPSFGPPPGLHPSRGDLGAPPLQPPLAPPLAPPDRPPSTLPAAHVGDDLDDDDTAGGGTQVADASALLAAARALPFGSAAPPAVPAAPPVAPRPIVDEDSAGTAVIDVAVLRAGTPLPFAGAPPGSVAPPSTPPSLEPSTLPMPPAPLAPPAMVAPPAFVAPPADAPPSVVGPPSSMGPPITAPMIVDEETAYSEPDRHPAEALPFPAAHPAAAAASPRSAIGLPFAPPAVGPLPATPVAAGAPTDDAPLGPEPRGDDVPAFTDGPFVVATLPWQIQPPKDSLTIIVKGSFQLVDGGPATALPEPQLPLGDVFAEDEPDKPLRQASDFAILKPQCDVLLHGHAHAPGGGARAMQIALRVKGAHGRIERQLNVFGDRTWQRALVAVAPTDPSPFVTIPITWERAFGGADFPANPHGIGYRARPGPDGVLQLPNFETPGHQIRSPDDVPPPASFAPIHPMWKARWGMLGTYDRAWFHERWPYFPKDFDFQYFQAAPVGQRLEKAVGDEEFELIGVVPGHPKLKGRLPGLKVRVFAKRTKEAGGGLTEIPVKLDTITFATEDARVDLVWRGWIDVTDDDAPEIERIFATTEPIDGPALSPEEVQRRFDAKLAPAPADPVAGPDPVEPPPAPEVEDPASQQLDADLAAGEKALEADLRARGVDPDAPPPAAPPPDPHELAASLRAMGADEADVAEIVAALEPTPDEVEPLQPPPIDLRRLVEERIARGDELANLDLRGADLRDLDLHEQDLTATDLTAAQLDRASLVGAKLIGAVLARASLEDARLDGADLTGGDLTQAQLEGASFQGAVLDEATLAGAGGEQVDFRKVRAVGGGFVGAKLPRARFQGSTLTGADFTKAVLDDAGFDGALMSKIRLYDARATKASFAGCDLTNARCEGAVFSTCAFTGVLADDSIWERADLTSSTFQGASLVSSSFVRARCWKTNFNEADLSMARLRKSHMNGASFIKANLLEASLERADFQLADLRGANLHAATIVKTQLKHARLEGAITSYSALGRKQP